ncbi:type I restriction endonuclease subunit R [Ellagibacter isourolithinifaciens]|uniref:type I restriction endonuclease subunit R n=1 Tax=Ellagibacter isourolithinifaciens TaxID=2137581 RepID=UPI003AF06351
MAKNRYSEEEAVQKPAGELLASMGWEVHYCFDEEELGCAGTLGRESYRDVLLKRDLEYALLELNEWMDETDAAEAIKTLSQAFVGDSLLQTNEAKYKMLRDGIPVRKLDANGAPRTELAQVFDFDHPKMNRFVAAEELWVHGPLHRRRCDLVGFVNGIPLVFMEFKRHDKDIRSAYNDNYTDYQDTVPQIFHFNAFVILSNGLSSRVGTLGSPYEFFNEWKRLSEEDAGSVSLETMLRGMCDREALLDLFQNFILFDHFDTPAAKIMARNHQYLGVNEALEAYKNRKLNDGKLGVFWHTQGSGKSYSMVFLAEKIRRTQPGSPTFLILTDREELNKQISETFESCGCLAGIPAARCRATSGVDLADKLKGNPSYIFSLIQKFNQTETNPIIPDHDIVVFSDEAHRSNNGIFAENMARLLPTASKMGFTGTPLLSDDQLTARTFGGYVSVYDFGRAVADGATVPLFYENRSDRLSIENPEINDELLQAVEDADLDPDQVDKVKGQLSHGIHIMMSEPRLCAIARDFVAHYTGIWESGKAMFICVNKVTCVMMYNYVQEEWARAIACEKDKLKSMGQQEALEQQRKIAWMESTEMAVVISQEQNEVARFRAWGLDIEPHRRKMEERNLDDEFKDADNPFRIVFVCAMWLTGFDVKPLSVMYFDKPLKAHNLMQAIARANRVAKGKSNGLIVDYVGVVKALRQALADYTRNPDGSGDPEDVVIDKDELINHIRELTEQIVSFMNERGFDLETLLAACGFGKLDAIKDAADAMSATDEVKKRFGIMCRMLFKLYRFVTRAEVGEDLAYRRDAVRAVYNQINQRRTTADTTELMRQVRDIVSEHVEIGKTTEQAKEGTRFDISGIDFDRLGQEFARAKQKHLIISDLRSVIEERLELALADNPLHIDFYKRYEEIISAYNKEQDKALIEKTFNDLMKLSEDLDEKQREWVREGFQNQQQMTVFEMLFKDTLTPSEIRKVKNVCIEMVEAIEKRLSEMVHWTEKEETCSQVWTIVRDEAYKLPESSYPDDVLSGCIKQIYDYFYSRDLAA